jgi:AcrR family transcriptional regulator
MTTDINDPTVTHPAHRPSRRTDILDAAIRLFARKGYVDAAISDVAEEADVVVTAIYYHFSGKEELFSAAVTSVFESISAVVVESRGGAESGEPADLAAAIDAVWNWIDTHPDDATLLYLQLPGATRQITMLRQEFEEQHMARAFGYLSKDSRGRTNAARRGVETLTVRTLVDMLISVHTMRLAHGPLSSESSSELRTSLHDVVARLVAS